MSANPELLAALRTRAADACELCGNVDDLRPLAVAPHADADAAHSVLLCGTCAGQLDGDHELDSKHWFCLQEAIWSQEPAVQVVAWRTASRLAESEQWARDLLEQAYLADEVLEWARQSDAADDEEAAPVFDSNGARLYAGDSVTLIKDLDVKGTSFVAKRGTLVKGIKLGDDPGLVEGRVNGVQIYLKTEFLKRAG